MHPPRLVLPPHAPGMRIGLFGGTFDPPHAAHLGASLLAMKRLKLDRMWWLVTPGNPLKDTRGLRPLDERMAAARASSPTIRASTSPVSKLSSTRATPTTRWNIWCAAARACGSSGSWAPTICGASTAGKTGARIANLMPMAVVDRMGSSLYATGGRAAQALAPLPPAGAAGRRPCRTASRRPGSISTD